MDFTDLSSDCQVFTVAHGSTPRQIGRQVDIQIGVQIARYMVDRYR